MICEGVDKCVELYPHIACKHRVKHARHTSCRRKCFAAMIKGNVCIPPIAEADKILNKEEG